MLLAVHKDTGLRYSTCTMYSCSIDFDVAQPQYDLLLTWVADKNCVCTKKKLSPAGFKLSTLAYEARALPSELLGGVNWASHASKASVDKN